MESMRTSIASGLAAGRKSPGSAGAGNGQAAAVPAASMAAASRAKVTGAAYWRTQLMLTVL